MTALAQHSSATFEWGSPPSLLAIGRRVLGGDFDFDPCSSAMWNEFVQARVFFDIVTDGTKTPWVLGRTNCNPPSGLVAVFFRLCIEAWERGSSIWWTAAEAREEEKTR